MDLLHGLLPAACFAAAWWIQHLRYRKQIRLSRRSFSDTISPLVRLIEESIEKTEKELVETKEHLAHMAAKSFSKTRLRMEDREIVLMERKKHLRFLNEFMKDRNLT